MTTLDGDTIAARSGPRPARVGRSREPVVRRGRPARSRGVTAAGRLKLALPVSGFLVAQVIPFQIYIGSLHMSATRILLLLTVIPTVIMWAAGRAGPRRFVDVAVLLFIVWCAIATTVIHGIAYASQSAGMLFIETAGAYFLARVYVRTEDDYYRTYRMLLVIVAILMPFAIAEAVTGDAVLMNLFSRVAETYGVTESEARWGMRRVQGPFEHPILFGVFCGAIFAPTVLVLGYRHAGVKKWVMSLVVVVTAFCSLSSGPLTALFTQIILVAWNWVLRGFAGRWKLLWLLFASAYVFLSVFSRQSPAQHLINLVAFDKGSAWQRLLIWNYGTASIAAHPLFGVGFGDWSRMEGQTSSVDMFWIISSLRHGILAGVFLGTAFIGALFFVGVRRGYTPSQLQCRTAFIIGMMGFFVGGWTVDFWAEVYTCFFFMLGSGMWLLHVPNDGPAGSSGHDQPAAGPSARRATSRPPVHRPRRAAPPPVSAGGP